MQNGFPTPIASRITGITPKTLENWAQRGVIEPSLASNRGHGLSRIYSFRDLIALRVIADLRDRGIEMRHLRKVIDYLRRRKGLDSTTSDVLATTILVTDGHDVYEIDGNARVSTLRHPDQSAFMVPLGRVVAKLRADAEQVRAA